MAHHRNLRPSLSAMLGTCYHTLDSELLDMDIATRPATISIVVPCFNERESLPIFLTELSRVSSLFKDSTPPA